MSSNPKTMNLEQFKEALSSDAQKRCNQLSETVRELQGNVRMLNDVIAIKNKAVHQLQNRCFAQTRGSLCPFCGFYDECTSRIYESKDREKRA